MIDPKKELHTIGLLRSIGSIIWIGLKRRGTKVAERFMKEDHVTEKGIMTGSIQKELGGINIGKY